MIRIALSMCWLGFVSFGFASLPLGDYHFDTGNYAEAVAEYRKITERTPDHLVAHLKLSKALTFLAGTIDDKAKAERTFGEAAEMARVAIRLDEANPDAHMELARALGRLAQYKGVFQALGLAGEVKRSLETALELAPEYGSALHALALFHHEAPGIAGGNAGQVEPLFDKAIEVEPEAISHRVEYAGVLIQRKNLEKAKEHLEMVLELPTETAADQGYRARAETLYLEHFGPLPE